MLGLAACGSGASDSDEGGASLSSVTIEGKQGEKPKVTFDGRLDSSEETEVLVEGDGETIADGDTVSTNWWVGNGFTQEEAQSTFGEGGSQSVEVSDKILPFLRETLIGHKVGDRVVLKTSAARAYGESGNASIGIGNKDSVLAVVDILGKVDILDAPQGEEKKPAGWAPSLIEKDGVITGLDFTDAHKPSGELIATTLVKGDGAVVEKGQTLHVRYLGQVYGADKPFDENFSAEDPASFPIGVGGVVAGWDERLVGRTVGSRVILEIPPAKGYGKKGNPQAGIKGTDTLFFVVDILGAS
ncbi:FKBP-type peptidyl-prolyl cis-trans isomerase [Nocardia sp. N13]|uniref:FKBP-type peptidyl-prolyl cis-trans isomerase n=1 Tax=Nocardioides sp. N13(2025) TaxID=3453405 RepID=UPI003F774EC1